MEDERIHYDSIWRRIKSDDYATKLEGQFRDGRDRLAALNNWGSLGWLYPHATATKLAHHRGVEHNALHFLEADPERKRYRPSFRIASHALHWGHLPLSYAGAEATLRAAHVHTPSRKVLDGIFQDVVSFGELTCETDHYEDCGDSVLSGEEPFELYKWLSAWLVARRWKRIWKAVKGLSETDMSEQEVKNATVRTLVCREDFGYQLLSLCRLADYVPRDLQQAGTAWLTVDIEALWERSPLRSDRAQEWSLLEAARDYLEDRFFMSPEAQLVHSLASRAIAQGLLNKGITREHLTALLTAQGGDRHYSTFLSEYHRRRLHDVEKRTKGETLNRAWSHIGTFGQVRIPTRSRLDAEDFFTGRTGGGRLSYPMTSNYIVIVRPESEGRFPEPAPLDRNPVSVSLYHRRDEVPGGARPALDIAFEARRRQAFIDRKQVSSGLMGWLVGERVSVRNRPVYRAAGRALLEDPDTTRRHLGKLGELAALSQEKDPGGYGRFVRSMARRPQMPEFGVGRSTLELPHAACRSKYGKKLLTQMREAASASAGTGGGASRGLDLEAAVAADQLLAEDPCTHRLLIVGATALSSEGQPIGEWDIIRIDLVKGGDWRIVAIECSVSDGKSKEEADREKLERLRVALHKRFSDLAEYRTRLAFPSEGGIAYDDASRGFVRT
ncbi:MAG: hypothetical protein ACTHN3_06010 [Solirubrobacterales bacterium]